MLRVSRERVSRWGLFSQSIFPAASTVQFFSRGPWVIVDTTTSFRRSHHEDPRIWTAQERVNGCVHAPSSALSAHFSPPPFFHLAIVSCVSKLASATEMIAGRSKMLFMLLKGQGRIAKCRKTFRPFSRKLFRWLDCSLAFLLCLMGSWPSGTASPS